MINASKLDFNSLLVFDKLCIVLYKILAKGKNLDLSCKNVCFIGLIVTENPDEISLII